MPLPDYMQRALGGTPAPAAPPARPSRPTGLPSYMKRALGEEEEEQEPYIPFLEQMEQEAAQQPLFRPPYSEVLAGVTRPPEAPATDQVQVDGATHPHAVVGDALLQTWQDIGDNLSAGSAQAVSGLARTVEEVGQGLASTPVLSPLGAPFQALGGELEQFKGREGELAQQDLQGSVNQGSLAGDVLQAVPGMVTTIGAGLATGGASAIPVATLTGGAQAFGSGMQGAEAAGADRDEALGYASMSAAGEMATEQLGNVRLLRRLLEGVPENQLTSILGDMALGGGEEMAAEVANSLSRVMTYDERSPAEALAGDADNILRSGLVGAILQGAGTGGVAVAQNRASAPAPDTISPEQGVGTGQEEIEAPASQETVETELPAGIAELRDASLAIGPKAEAVESLPELGVERVPEGQQLIAARGEGGGALGYLLARPDEDGFRVAHVFVDEAARGQGIPELLYRQAAEQMGPYQGSTDYEGRRAPAGEEMAARLRETAPEIFPQEEPDYREMTLTRAQSTPGYEFNRQRGGKYFTLGEQPDGMYTGPSAGLGSEGGPHTVTERVTAENPLVLQDFEGKGMARTLMEEVDPDWLRRFDSVDLEGKAALLEERGIDPSIALDEKAGAGVALDRVAADYAREQGHDYIVLQRDGGQPEYVVQLNEREEAPPALPSRLRVRAGEMGFVQPRAFARDLKRFVRKNFTKEGLLSPAAKQAVFDRDGRVAARAERIRVISMDIQKELRAHEKASRTEGFASRETRVGGKPLRQVLLKDVTAGTIPVDKLARYLDDAYRGMNLRTGGDLLDDTQIERIARKRGVSPELIQDAQDRAHTSDQGGLLLAPQFIPLIRELRVETDALSRELRRQGLLTDSNAKALEREFGLYVPRQYEAIRNEKHLERIKSQPLWNRAYELTEQAWNKETLRQRLQKIDEDGGAQLPKGELRDPLTWPLARQKKEAIRRGDAKALRLLAGDPQAFDRLLGKVEAAVPHKTQEQILGIMEEYITRSANRPIMPGGHPEGALDTSGLMERGRQSELQRLLLGEIRDIRGNAVHALAQLGLMVEQQKLLQELRAIGTDALQGPTQGNLPRPGGKRFLYEDPQTVDGEAHVQQIDPGMFVKAHEVAQGAQAGPHGPTPGLVDLAIRQSKRRSDPLGDLYATQDVIDELTQIFDNPEVIKAVEVYSKISFWVKAMKTVGSPLQAVNRNMLSNVPYALINGVAPVSPSRLKESWKTSYEKVFGGTDRSTSRDVEYMLELGLFDQTADVGETKRLERKGQVFKTDDPNKGKAGRVVEKLGEYYSAPDNLSKRYVFLELMGRYQEALPGVPEAEVARFVAGRLRNSMQNYGAVPRAVKALAENPIIAPFPSFTWEVFRNSGYAVVQAAQDLASDNPKIKKIGAQRAAGLLAAAALPLAASLLFRWICNMDDEDEEAARLFMPPWNRNGTVLFLPGSPDGQFRYLDWGFIDPFARLKEPVMRLLHGDVKGARESLMAPLSEELLAKSLMDLRSNKRSDTGRPIYNEKDGAWRKAATIGGYSWKALGPGGGLSITRIVAAHIDDEKAAWPEYLALMGPRIVTIDVKEGLGFKAFAYKNGLLEARAILRREARKGTADMADQIAAEQAVRREVESMVELVNAARRYDLSTEDIEEALSAAQIAKWEQTGLLDGAVEDIVGRLMERDIQYTEEQEAEEEGVN
jgi:GNAT superfamily N-acetyltransferase